LNKVAIAITAITSFIVYPIAGSLLIIRITTMLAASVLGILGIVLVSIAYFIHMCTLKSVGVNYLSPFTPLSGSEIKWKFPDGSRPQGTTATYTFPAAGTFKVSFEVAQPGLPSVQREHNVSVAP
jgi:hypothetical protein